jgi:predicted RNA-binding Zn-ribbon protein involved in translation (DUF1610 family)
MTTKSKKAKPKSISEVCPNCVETLVLQQKKLGGLYNWFVCPKCGYRERPSCDGFAIQQTGNFIDNIKRKNIRNINSKYNNNFDS